MNAAYLCPACRTATVPHSAAWHCPACGRDFPVLFGIADFRLAPDPYLSLADERAKAARLHAFARGHSFEETLAEYYRITDDVPPDMALRFAAYVRTGVARGRAVLARFEPDGGAVLDAGCGAGGLLVAAAAEGRPATGLDIALRWLVIAQKQLEEAGLSAELVCADIAAPPFPDGRFAHIVAADLFEHLPDQARAAARIRALLAPGGRLFATGANRFTLARYPLAGLWGVGFLPRGLRRRYVTWRRGFDTLRHARPVSPAGLAGLLRRAGFQGVRTAPAELPADRIAALGGLQKGMATAYSGLRSLPPARTMLVQVGPAFEIEAENPLRDASRARKEI